MAQEDLELAKRLYIDSREKGAPHWETLTPVEQAWWVGTAGAARAKVQEHAASRRPLVGRNAT